MSHSLKTLFTPSLDADFDNDNDPTSAVTPDDNLVDTGYSVKFRNPWDSGFDAVTRVAHTGRDIELELVHVWEGNQTNDRVGLLMSYDAAMALIRAITQALDDIDNADRAIIVPKGRSVIGL